VTFAAFLADPNRENNFAVTMYPVVAADGTAVTLRYANRILNTNASDTPANTRFWPRLLGPAYRYQTQVIPIGTLGVQDSERSGEIRLGQVMGDLDTGSHASISNAGVASIRDLTFGGRKIVIQLGGRYIGGELTFSSYGTVLEATMEEARVESDAVVIPYRAKHSRFEHPLQKRVFMGLGADNGALTGCIYFDGTGDYVTIGTNSTFDIGSNARSWRFKYWPQATGSTQMIVSRGLYTIDGATIQMSSSNTIQFITSQAAAAQSTSSSSTLTAEHWYDVVVTYNGSTTCKIYLDGALDNSGATHTAPTTNAARNLYFAQSDISTQLLTGFLSEISFHDHELTADEVSDLYQRRLNSAEIDSTVLGYWPANDSVGSGTLADSSATAANGTVTNAVFRYPMTGDAALAGQVLPDVFGYVESFEPVQINEANPIYQVHSGPVNAISTVREGGDGAAISAGTAYTTLASFLAATTTAGTYDTLICAGGSWIRLANNPTLPITVEVQGDKGGGTYRVKAADLVRYIACNRGDDPLTDPTDLNTSAFTTLNTANSSTLGYATTREVTVKQVIDFLLRTVGAVSWFRRSDGLWTVQQFTGSASLSPSLTITERDLKGGELKSVPVDPPSAKITMKYRHNYRKHALTELASGISATATGRWLQKDNQFKWIEKDSLRSTFKDSQTITIDSAFTTEANTWTELVRLFAILDGKARAYEIPCRDRLVQVDVMDGVYFNYQDRDANGAAQNRLGTSASDKWVVLGVQDQGNNEVVLTIWQEG